MAVPSTCRVWVWFPSIREQRASMNTLWFFRPAAPEVPQQVDLREVGQKVSRLWTVFVESQGSLGGPHPNRSRTQLQLLVQLSLETSRRFQFRL